MLERSPAKNTRTPIRLPATVPGPSNANSQCGSAKGSRCSLPISSAFLGWADSDCAAQLERMTSSSSSQLHKTSAYQPRYFLHRSKFAKPDRKGARAPYKTRLSATATRCFSTEPAQSRLCTRSSDAAVRLVEPDLCCKRNIFPPLNFWTAGPLDPANMP
jgi:hypothetical protein